MTPLTARASTAPVTQNSNATPVTSPKRLARIARLLCLAVGVFGGFAIAQVSAAVYVPGDAATTTTNVWGTLDSCALASSRTCYRDLTGA